MAASRDKLHKRRRRNLAAYSKSLTANYKRISLDQWMGMGEKPIEISNRKKRTAVQ